MGKVNLAGKAHGWFEFSKLALEEFVPVVLLDDVAFSSNSDAEVVKKKDIIELSDKIDGDKRKVELVSILISPGTLTIPLKVEEGASTLDEHGCLTPKIDASVADVELSPNSPTEATIGKSFKVELTVSGNEEKQFFVDFYADDDADVDQGECKDVFCGRIEIQVSPKGVIGEKIWSNFMKVSGAEKRNAQQAAEDKWGVAPNDWYIYRTKSMKQFSPIYEYFYNSAEKHSSSPEFIQAVAMGEGLHLLLEELRSAGTGYDADQAIDGYAYLGADEIGSNIDTLVNNGYIDAKHKANITAKHVVNELGEPKLSAVVTGYETAVEVIAAELHSRRDWILEFIAKNSLDVDTSDSDTVDFLTYATYNNVSVGMEAARNIAHYMRKYTGAQRDDQRNVRFNTLKRLATSDWYKEVKVYDI